MTILWAPWREKYIEQCGMKKDGCVFCHIYQEKKDIKNFVFLRSTHCFAVLNIYPFSSGHSLVIPNRHVADLSDLSSAEREDLMSLLIEAKKIMALTLKPEGVNVGMNLGRAAGGGIPDHLHVHIVPRWNSDVNFMASIFETKVMPVSLSKVYKRLKDAIKAGHRKIRK